MSICYVNGSYEEKNSAMISIQDRGFNFSDGVYEVMSFFGNQVINFDKHVKQTCTVTWRFKNSKTIN